MTRGFDSLALRRSIAAWLPVAAGAELLPLAEGWNCAALNLGGRVIVKRPKRAEAEAGLQREAEVLALVRPQVSLPLPDLHLIEDPLLSWHETIPGERLEAAGYGALSLVQRADLAVRLALFHAEVHRVTVPCAGPAQAWAAPARLAEVVPLLPP